MAYSEVTWGYKSGLEIAKLNQMDDNSVWTSEHRIWGCEVQVTGSSTAEVSPGRVEINGKWLQETTTANLTLTAENNAHWREGATQEVTSTSWYIYAYNSAGSTFSIKFGLSAPAYSDTSSATSVGEKQYDKSGSVWFRCLGMVHNGSAADAGSLLKQNQYAKHVYYDNPGDDTLVLNNTATTTFTDINCRPYLPPFSRLANFSVRIANPCLATMFRVDGSLGTGTLIASMAGGGDGQGNVFLHPTSSAGIVEYKNNSGNSPLWVNIVGYSIEGIRG